MKRNDGIVLSGVVDTIIEYTAQVVTDMTGQSLHATVLHANNFEQDREPPRILNFDLDMTNRELVMYFDETVRETTLNVTQLAFLADVSAVSTIPPVWLTSNSVLQRQVNDTVIAITIGVLDMNSIKAAGSTAIGAASTFLAVLPGAISDMNQNKVQERVLGWCLGGTRVVLGRC